MSEAWKKISGWSEGGDDLPNFGKKARGWFIRMVRGKLSEPAYACRYRMTAEEIEPLVEWYASDPMSFVVWVDCDEYRGRGWSSGAWQIAWDEVRDALGPALDEMRLANDNAAIRTLDDWLKADLTGSFEFKGASGGSEKLPKKLRRALLAAARERRRNLPRVCACGAQFKPASNRQRRCKKCSEAALPVSPKNRKRSL